MNQLVTIFGSDALGLWSQVQSIEIFTVDWERIRDSNAPKKGKYSVSRSRVLSVDEVALWKALIVEDFSWTLDSHTRHRLTPTHLMSITNGVTSMLLLFSIRGNQFGFEREGELVFADLHPTTATVIGSWIPEEKAPKNPPKDPNTSSTTD